MADMIFKGDAAPAFDPAKPQEAKVIRAYSAGVIKAASAEVNPDDPYTVDVVISRATTDREGDQIVVSGIDLKNFNKNPVVLFQHNSNEIVAKGSNIRVDGDKLLGSATFAPEGSLITADKVRRLVQLGMLNAVSIGVMPKEYTFMDMDSPWNGIKYLQSEMLEFSFVTIPAHADAMIISRAMASNEAFKSFVSMAKRRSKTITEAVTDAQVASAAAPEAGTTPPASPPPEQSAAPVSAAELVLDEALAVAEAGGSGGSSPPSGDGQQQAPAAPEAGTENPPQNAPQSENAPCAADKKLEDDKAARKRVSDAFRRRHPSA